MKRLTPTVAALGLGLALACQQAEDPKPGAQVSAEDQLDIREDMCEKDPDPASCREQVAELRGKLDEMRKTQ